jgi:nucleotide-binding universal stress UspA family protein
VKIGDNNMQSEQVFKKILVPIDGSIPSVTARELAAFVAKKFNSKVTVIHVVAHELMGPVAQRFTEPENRHEHPHVGYGGVVMPPPMHAPEAPDTSYFEKIADEITNAYREEGEGILSDAVDALKEDGVSADQKLVVDADPSNAVLKVAEEGNYDMIVMGGSGEQEKEPHLGSVAKKVAHRAKIPVLITRGSAQITKILAPVNGSDYSHRAVEYAASLAKKATVPMTLLYVQETSIFRLRPEVSKEIGKRVLSDSKAKIEGVEVDEKLESGDPAKTILKTANKGDYDLIIIGSRGHSTTEMFMLGSVSDHVVQYANRSVLVTK